MKGNAAVLCSKGGSLNLVGFGARRRSDNAAEAGAAGSFFRIKLLIFLLVTSAIAYPVILYSGYYL